MKIFILKHKYESIKSSMYWYGKGSGSNWLHAKWYETEDAAELDKKEVSIYFDIPVSDISVVETATSVDEVKQREAFFNEVW